MDFGTLSLPFGGPRKGVVNQPPSGIVLTNLQVNDQEAVGFVVGYAVAIDPDLGDTHTFEVSPANTYFQMVGDELRVKASISGVADQNITIVVTDTEGNTYSEAFVVDITTAQVDPGSNSGDLGSETIEDDTNFQVTPKSTKGPTGVTFAGRAGGKAAFIVDLGAARANHKLSASYTIDGSGLKNLGKDVFVGFGFLNTVNDNFHMIGLGGDGDGGIQMRRINGTGNFKGASGFTITDLGTPTNGVNHTDELHQRILISSGGTTYNYYTAASDYKNVDAWDAELTAQSPSPFTNSSDAPVFGLAFFMPATDHGTFEFLVNWWREQVFQGTFGYRTANQTVSANVADGLNQTAELYDTENVRGDGHNYVGFAGRRLAGGGSVYRAGQFGSGEIITVRQIVGTANAGGNANRLDDLDQTNRFAHQSHSHPRVLGANETFNSTIQQSASADFEHDSGNRTWSYSHLRHKHMRGALVRQTSAQSNAGSGAWNAQNMNSPPVYDDLGMWSAGSPERLTCPAAYNGRYFIFRGQANIDAGTSYSAAGIQIVGGPEPSQIFNHGTDDDPHYGNVVTPPIQMTTGSYARLIEFHGLAQSRNSVLSDVGVWIGAELLDENFLGCCLYKTATQGFSSNTTAIQHVWGGTRYDIGSWKSGNTIVVPSGVTKIQIGFGIEHTSSQYKQLSWVRKNGSDAWQGMPINHHKVHSSNTERVATWSAPIIVSPGDVFDVRQSTPTLGVTAQTNPASWFAAFALEHSR